MNTDDIWAEIDSVFGLPERLPGDIDATQMAERYDVCQTSALRKMQRLVASGEYKYVVVKDDTNPNKRRKIIRLVTPE
jgi:hypothetical protein